MNNIPIRLVMWAALLTATAPAFAKSPIEGQWENPKGNVTVRIGACGPALCGTVVDASTKAKAKVIKAGRAPLVGTRVMTDLRPSGHGTFKGRAYDPKRNIHAPATVRIVGPSTLVVRGCLVSGIVCKEQRWTRVG